MVCPFDRAQALELRQRKRPIGPSLTHCEDCDNEIPAARQALGGMTRCVPCQSIFEREVRR